MEYEKHIKRLVLGYLKTQCKSSYRRFLKNNFQNGNKHIATRVAGQTLEDILRIYSRIQDIVQGRLEETEYYKEYGAEFSSPGYLAEHLLYLLEKGGRPFTPSVSTVCGRSTAASSVADTHYTHDDGVDHVSDVEATPEHTLPGNIFSNDDNSQFRTPFRRKSPVFRTPYLEKIPTEEQENISSVISMKLLQKTDFHEKLAQNINTALTTPDLSSIDKGSEQDADKRCGAELEDTIKNALTRIEADPIFEDLLEDFIDPVVNTLGKVITTEATHFSRSSAEWVSKSSPNVEEQINGAVSSILAVTNISSHSQSNDPNPSVNDDASNKNENKPSQSEQISTDVTVSKNLDANINQLAGTVSASEQIPGKIIASEQTVNNVSSSGQVELIQQDIPTVLENQQIIHAASEMFNLPSTTMAQSSNQQQQVYILNQPLVIPQSASLLQVIQPGQTISKSLTIDSNIKIMPQPNINLTEQDIMSMPTIILNERNEITYADPSSITVNTTNTPYKLTEVHNIKEYFNVFGPSDHSPIIMKRPKKQPIPHIKHPLPPIKATPTIKVEVFHVDTPFPNNESVEEESSKNQSEPINSLPNLGDAIDSEANGAEDTSDDEIPKPTAKDDEVASTDKSRPKSLGSVCTPSPIIASVRKPTPKSGSHVRNLTFPSPLRNTPNEKPDANQNSPSVLSKQQASKDLFKSTPEEAEISHHKKSPKGRGKSDAKKSRTSSPRKASSPKKRNTPKNKPKPTKKSPTKNTKNEQTTPESWDTVLRKHLTLTDDENQSTPVVRRTSTRKRSTRSTGLDISDPDGKKIEEDLKTPRRSTKTKRKAPSKKKKTSRVKKPKQEKKLVQIEEETPEETKVEPKKILSPSKLCNTASKRNMEVDGITPNNAREITQQLVSNARKNITSLLDTPLKEDGSQPSAEANLDPFTPMLKANLEGFTDGDTFSINTPNFPVTPGMNLMERSSASYCILNDTETNKATEAIVLSEERKSSVRKTDEEDVEMVPKVYGCKELLDNFNSSRVGKKNLELLDSRGVTWDGSSEKDDRSDNSESNSDGEPNDTVIQKSNKHQTKNKAKISRKSMGDESRGDVPCGISTRKTIESPEDQETKCIPSDNKDERHMPRSSKDTSSSSDSEIIANEKFRNKQADNSFEGDKNLKNTSMNPKIKKGDKGQKNYCTHRDNTSTKGSAEQTRNAKDNSDKRGKNTKNDICEHENINTDPACEDCNDGITSHTAEDIKRTVLTVCLDNWSSHATTSYSIKAEMDEKRRRVIALEKEAASQTSTRRRTVKSQSSSSSLLRKRKQSAPFKMTTREEQTEISCRDERVYSQEEFFEKSGTNLHRNNKQSVGDNKEVLEPCVEETSRNIVNKDEARSESRSKKSKCNSTSKNEDRVVEQLTSPTTVNVKPPRDQKTSAESNKSGEDECSFWDECAAQLQPEEIIIKYDENNTAKKRLEDKNFNLPKKIFIATLPLIDGSVEQIPIELTPFKILWEVEPGRGEASTSSAIIGAGVRATPDCSSDSEYAVCKTGDPDEARCAKKRKHRSDSCNSSSSSKRMKTSLLNENNIEKLLTKLHGPSEKT